MPVPRLDFTENSNVAGRMTSQPILAEIHHGRRDYQAMDEFKNFRVLIVDPAGYSKNLLRGILTTLGIGRIETLTRTDEALGLLRMEFFHLMFCDENAGRYAPFPSSRRCAATWRRSM
jgi:hypothetical protein